MLNRAKTVFCLLYIQYHYNNKPFVHSYPGGERTMDQRGTKHNPQLRPEHSQLLWASLFIQINFSCGHRV